MQQSNHINHEGELIVTSQKTRTQSDNLHDCLERVKDMLKKAAWEPDPPSEEIGKRVKEIKEVANEKRLDKKKKSKDKRSSRKKDSF